MALMDESSLPTLIASRPSFLISLFEFKTEDSYRKAEDKLKEKFIPSNDVDDEDDEDDEDDDDYYEDVEDE
jgi:hypothetical protein